MLEISEVQTVKQFLERAADIADAGWPPLDQHFILSALTFAAYPEYRSNWNGYNEPWWADHIRLRGMDVKAQEAVRLSQGGSGLVENDKSPYPKPIAEILREAAGWAE